MAELSSVEKKIRIQGNGIKISRELKIQLQAEGYYPIALTWIGDDLTGPFSFTGYGDNSPFELRKVDGAYQVFENGKHFTEVSFYRKPKFWEQQWALNDNEGTIFIDEGISGVITPCAPDVLIDEADDLLRTTGGKFPYITLACYNGLVIWPSWGCLYNKQKSPCRFCCIPGEYDDTKVLINHEGWLENLANAFEAAVDELGPDIHNCSLTVDAGTLPGRDKGAWAYIKVLKALKARLAKLPEMIYVRAVIEPPHDEATLYSLREAGFTSIQMDVDVYDDGERRSIMPNAKGSRPIEDYTRVLQKAREVFLGEVATQMIAGIQKDENLLRGVDHFAAIGVPTLVTPFLPFGQGLKLSREAGIEVPDSEKMKRIYERAAEILTKHNVPAPEFRGGVSSLAETMGRRLKRAPSLTNNLQAVAN